MTYLDVWRSGTFLLYSCKAAFWIQGTLLRLSDVERSVVLRSVFAIGSALAYLLFFRECATPPHVQVCHTTWLSFTRPSPILVLQVTNAGVRRPGYKAILRHHCWLVHIITHWMMHEIKGSCDHTSEWRLHAAHKHDNSKHIICRTATPYGIWISLTNMLVCMWLMYFEWLIA